MSAKRKALDENGNGFVGDALEDLHIFAIRRRMGKWIVVHADKNLSAGERPYFVDEAHHRVRNLRNLRNVDLVIVESYMDYASYVAKLNEEESDK